jgi:hypothetical protein
MTKSHETLGFREESNIKIYLEQTGYGDTIQNIKQGDN